MYINDGDWWLDTQMTIVVDVIVINESREFHE